jgi:hypothetical protein
MAIEVIDGITYELIIVDSLEELLSSGRCALLPGFAQKVLVLMDSAESVLYQLHEISWLWEPGVQAARDITPIMALAVSRPTK